MKRINKYLSVIALSLLLTFGLSFTANAQDDPAPPDIEGSGGVVGGQNGGASVDGGMNLFLLFALVYGAKRIYSARRKEEENSAVVANE